MARRDEWYRYRGVIKAGTAKAILFHGEEWDEASWVPRGHSIIQDEGQDGAFDVEYTVDIAGWLVAKNDWPGGVEL